MKISETGRLVNYSIVFNIIGRILFIQTGALLVCASTTFFFREDMFPFLQTAAISLITGTALFLSTKGKNEFLSIHKRESYMIVTLSWLIISITGSFPFIFSGSIPSFVDSFFESISGFTTTGASILTDIESLPKSILLWRSTTHWIGGIGIIVLVIMIMPSLRIGSYHLFTLESSLQEKIQPKIKAVGKRLLLIYLILTFSEVLLLMAGGMNLFESICHSFGTVATGGFSPKNASIAEYSPYLQYVIMLFMLLAGTNYGIHYFLLKRDLKRIKENEEFRFYLFVIFAVGMVITASLCFEMHKPFEESFRAGFFQVISIITCTGFATADYLQWPVYAWTLIFMAMFLGGSTGSTAGGIKMARHLVAFRNLGKFFHQCLFPNTITHLKLNKKTIDEETNRSILTFILNYFLVFLSISAMLVLLGIDAKTSAGSVATCLAGIGPGLGSVGPASNFAHLPDLAKVILSLTMLLGRLEIYTVLMLFTKGFWKVC